MKKIVTLFLILTFFMGCVTTTNESIQNLESEKGIVLFNVTSKNINKFELYYQKNTDLMDFEGLIQMNKTVICKDKFDIILIKAGNYKFSKINKDGKLLNFPENEGFKVEPGKITYIGDLSIDYNRQNFDDSFNVGVKYNQEKTLAAAVEDLPALTDYEVVKQLLIVNNK